MRASVALFAIALLPALLSNRTAVAQDSEWTDLFAHDLRDWSRFGDGESPWRFSKERILSCENASEIYIPERDFRDGTFKFEYRFRPSDKKTGFKAGVWVRRTLQETGCKIALGDDCGMMSATIQTGSDRNKTVEQKPAVHCERAPGLWNLARIRLQGKTFTMWINGREVASFNQCDTAQGLIALEVDGSAIEFRRMMWKDSE
jgi:hypothetical protein